MDKKISSLQKSDGHRLPTLTHWLKNTGASIVFFHLPVLLMRSEGKIMSKTDHYLCGECLAAIKTERPQETQLKRKDNCDQRKTLTLL